MDAIVTQNSTPNLTIASVTQYSTPNLTIASVTKISYIYIWYFIIGIAGTTIALFGILGNVTSAIVLLLPAMRNSTSTLLVVLAVYDMLFLILYALMQTLPQVFIINNVFGEYQVFRQFLYKYFYGVMHISHNGTIYMTILIALERALVVLLPFKAKLFCTHKRACLASLLVLVWSVIYSIPRFLKFVQEPDNNMNSTEYIMVRSSFGKSYLYNVVYLEYLNGIFYFVIPVGVIIILNTAIAQRLCTRGSRSIAISSTRGDSQMRLTVMIIVLTAIFCVCQLLNILKHTLYPSIQTSTGVEEFQFTCSLSCNVVYAVAEASRLLNSASNFIVYSIYGRKFRRCLQDLCCFCR